MDDPKLKRFFSAVRDLRDAMESDLQLDQFDRLSLENYLALLQITYSEWKKRNHPNLTHSGFSVSDNDTNDSPLSSSLGNL